MKELSADSYYNRWIITTYCINRVQKNLATDFSIVKNYKKYLSLSSAKRKQNIYIVDYGSCGIYNSAMRPKVVMSEGLLQTFSDEEIDAIIFHEEYHQKNWDPLKLFCFV